MTTTRNIFLPWLIFISALGFVFYKYVLQVSPSVMTHQLMATFHLNGVELGSLVGSYFYAYLLMQLPVGVLLDRFPARNLIAFAIFMCAIAATIFHYTDNIYIAYLGRIMIGLFGAFSMVGTMKLISLLFPSRRFAFLAGIMMTLAMLGAVAAQGPLAVSVTHLGWRGAMQLLAIAGFILAAIFFLLSRTKRQHTSDSGLTFRDILYGVVVIAKNKNSWLIALYSGLAFAPINAFAGLWGVSYLSVAYNQPETTMASIVSLTFIGFAIGAPFSGWYSSRGGKRKPIMLLGTLIALLCLLISLYIHLPLTLLGIVMFIMGFFISFFFVSFAYIRELNSDRYSGSSIGFINMFNALCGAIAEPLIGKLLDIGWHGKIVGGAHAFSQTDYKFALIILPIGILISIALLMMSKETYCRTAT